MALSCPFSSQHQYSHIMGWGTEISSYESIITGQNKAFRTSTQQTWGNFQHLISLPRSTKEH